MHCYYRISFIFQRSIKAQHDLELIKADSDTFHISWRRININSNIERDLTTEDAEADVYTSGEGKIIEQSPSNQEAYPNLPKTWISRPTQSCVELHFDGSVNSVRYPGRPDRQSAVFRWIVIERFCNLNKPLDIDHEQFEVLTRAFK